ncbi:MAG: CdaR family protein [Symbiobacteriia bacterium]
MDRWLERDNTLKIVALVLAVFLWLYVSTDQSQQSRKTFEAVRPTVQNLPASLTLLDPQALPAVRVTVEGSALAVGKVHSNEVVATLSLRDAKAGLQPAAVEVSVPAGVHVLEIYPQFISVQVEPRKTTRVPVQIKQVGDLGQDYQVLGITPAVTAVVVDGPASRVDQVSQVFGPVSLNGVTIDQQDQATFTLQRTATLGALDKSGQQVPGVTVTPASLPVNVAVRHLPPGVDVPVEARITGQPAPGYRVGEIVLSQPTAKVRATDLAAVRGVTVVLTQPIDIKGASADVQRDAALQLPAGAEMLQPATVTVTIRIVADTLARTFEAVPIQLHGAAAGLTGSVSPNTVSLRLEGPRQVMDALKPGDMVVYVAVDGLDAGDYQLPIQVSLPQGVRATDTSPRIAAVSLVRTATP